MATIFRVRVDILDGDCDAQTAGVLCSLLDEQDARTSVVEHA